MTAEIILKTGAPRTKKTTSTLEDDFAIEDGFSDWLELTNWFDKAYGISKKSMDFAVIKWGVVLHA